MVRGRGGRRSPRHRSRRPGTLRAMTGTDGAPPARDERTQLTTLLDRTRDAARAKCDGVSPENARKASCRAGADRRAPEATARLPVPGPLRARVGVDHVTRSHIATAAALLSSLTLSACSADTVSEGSAPPAGAPSASGSREVRPFKDDTDVPLTKQLTRGELTQAIPDAEDVVPGHCPGSLHRSMPGGRRLHPSEGPGAVGSAGHGDGGGDRRDRPRPAVRGRTGSRPPAGSPSPVRRGAHEGVVGRLLQPAAPEPLRSSQSSRSRRKGSTVIRGSSSQIFVARSAAV